MHVCAMPNATCFCLRKNARCRWYMRTCGCMLFFVGLHVHFLTCGCMRASIVQYKKNAGRKLVSVTFVCLLVIACAGILSLYPLPILMPLHLTTLWPNIHRVLFPRPRPSGGDSPSGPWARDGNSDWRAAAPPLSVFLFAHHGPAAAVTELGTA